MEVDKVIDHDGIVHEREYTLERDTMCGLAIADRFSDSEPVVTNASVTCAACLGGLCFTQLRDLVHGGYVPVLLVCIDMLGHVASDEMLTVFTHGKNAFDVTFKAWRPQEVHGVNYLSRDRRLLHSTRIIPVNWQTEDTLTIHAGAARLSAQ